MKIFKKVLIVLAILVLAIAAVGLLFFPSHIHVERSVVINQSPTFVYDYANDLKNYQQWSPWYELDTAANYSFSNNTIGKGATMNWESKVKNVGKGSMTITDETKDSKIALDLNFMENGVAKAEYLFSPEGSGTKMTWTLDFEAGMNPLMRIMGKFMDKMVGPDFEKGLNKLKAKTESMPTAPNMSVEQMDFPETNYMFLHGHATMQNIGPFLGSSFQKIVQAMAKQKLTQAGAPFAIYYSESQNEWEMDAAIPTSGVAKNDGEIKAGTIKAGKVVCAKFFGNYDKTSIAHTAAKEYCQKNNLTITGAPWESYITDPMLEKDTAKWQTNVCYPVR